MEWYKIKNILIIALLLTNLLFVIAIINDNNSNSSTDATENELLTYTLNVLENNEIYLSKNIEIPQIKNKMSVLTLSYDKKNGTYNYKKSNTHSSEPLSSEEALKSAEKALNSLNIDTNINNNLKYESINKLENTNSYEVKYCDYYNGLKIEDSYIIIQISSNGVEKITRNLAYAEAAGKSKQKIVPITTALLTFMNQIKSETQPLSDKNEITDISMIYKVDSPYEGNATTDTAFPFWKITANNKSIYISAYN